MFVILYVLKFWVLGVMIFEENEVMGFYVKYEIQSQIVLGLNFVFRICESCDCFFVVGFFI